MRFLGPQGFEDVRIFIHNDNQSIICFLLNLLVCHITRTVIGNCCCLDNDIYAIVGCKAGLQHFIGGFNLHCLNIRRYSKRRGTADKQYFSTALGSHLSYGIAHLAAGTVADKADGVNRLTCTCCGNEYLQATQVALTAGKKAAHKLHNLLRFRQTAGAAGAAGKMSGNRRHYSNTAALQLSDIFLSCSIKIHTGIHCGANNYRCLSCQKRSAQQIIRNAICHFSQNISGSRRN